MNKRILVSLGGFIILTVAGFALFKMMTSKKPKESQLREFLTTKFVNTQTAEYKDINTELNAYGRVISDRTIEVFSEVSGVMDPTFTKFKVGNSFLKDEVMIKIVDDEQKLSYFSQKSEFLNILTSIMPDMKIDFPESYPKWNKYINEYSIEKELKKIPEPSSAQEKFFLSSRKVFQLYYNLENFELRLNKHIIKAPFNGTVTESLVEAGSLIRLNQKLGRFSGTGNFEIELSLTPEQVDLVNIGTEIKAYLDENRIFNGRLIRISKFIDPSTQTYKVYASISGIGITDGLYLKVSIFGQKLQNVINIPRKALLNNNFVHLIDNGKLSRKQAEIIKLGENNAYIRGINNGEKIITDPIANPILGMKVESINN